MSDPIKIEMTASEEQRAFQHGCDRIAEALRAAAIVADVQGHGGLSAYLKDLAAQYEDPKAIVRLLPLPKKGTA